VGSGYQLGRQRDLPAMRWIKRGARLKHFHANQELEAWVLLDRLLQLIPGDERGRCSWCEARKEEFEP
jgi:hypothetical protein